MSETYVAEYVEIIDEYGERKGVCVTDTEHTVSFEVKDEYVAMELCELLNKLFGENEELRISIKLFEDDVNRLSKENEQLRKQMQNYEQLIDNSYVGEEETLDGFVGKYVIWEDELQKANEKLKKGDD